MNRDHPSPENHGQFAGHGADPQRQAETEQRLKAARPRPAELDIEAIVRSARAVDQPVVLPESPAERRGTRSYGWSVAVAGSWACGAIVGALVTFVLLSRATPPQNPSDGVTTLNEELPKVAGPGGEDASDDEVERPPRDDSPPRNVPTCPASDSFASVALLDPYGCGAARYGEERPILRAGDFARNPVASRSSRNRQRTSAVQQGWAHTTEPGSDAGQDMTPRAAPAPSITQEQLLRELLGARPDSVL